MNAKEREFNRALGRNMLRARKHAHLTQGALANLIGVTPGMIGAIERGVQGVNAWRFARLCEALQVAPDEMVDFEPEPDHPDQGHTFTFTWTLRGSSKVVGDAHHTDAPSTSDPVTLRVRAWSLRDALRKLSQIPFPVLMGLGSDDEELDESIRAALFEEAIAAGYIPPGHEDV